MFDAWKIVLAEVEQAISREQYSTWFTGTELLSIEDGVVTIGAPNIFKIKQLQVKYTDIIRTALEHNNIPVKKLEYVITGATKNKARVSEKAPVETKTRTVTPTTMRSAPLSANPTTFQTGLNPRYTLESFVVGTNNELAASVARNIIDQPGRNYNPFFLYGGSGLGKTHLVQAIGNELIKRNPSLKIFYTPVSNFYSDFINLVKKGKGREFHQKYQKLDVLIIDDFQMMVRKHQSQNEFFDIFNEMYALNKQIIVTSDRIPSEIETVDVRLASRLVCAGAFDLQLPQFEDKCAILKAKAEFEGIEIEDEAIEYLADNVKTNIRDLEGEFKRLAAIAELKGISPLAVINEGYGSISRNPQNRSVTPKQVIDRVAKYYNLTPKEMCSKSRVANIKNARQIAMYLLSKELNMSTTKIASEVGVKDHTTVMHGVKKIEKDLKLRFDLRDQITELRDKLYA